MTNFSYLVIGKMYATKPEFNDEGELINEPTYHGGYHVNAAGEIPTEWEQYEIDAPATPLRVYQNQTTRFFCFPDESVFNELLSKE